MRVSPKISKKLSVCCVAIGCFSGVTASCAVARPNLIVIFADDLGYGDIGAPAIREIEVF